VDDNATNRVVAQALCEMFGCTSETAEDGVEALEAVQERRFDLVLMDIKMPRMDGVQATMAIRALDGPANALPIVALTANADPDDARKYLEIGMAAVVEKPIKPERLRMAMNLALEQAAADGESRGPSRDVGEPFGRLADFGVGRSGLVVLFLIADQPQRPRRLAVQLAPAQQALLAPVGDPHLFRLQLREGGVSSGQSA
jgi:CheY-like chemotaxis protein